MHRRRFVTAAAALGGLGATMWLPRAASAAAPSLAEHPRADSFIAAMQGNYDYSPRKLRAFLESIHPHPQALKLIGTPTKPRRRVYWLEYRRHRLTARNIARGKKFMEDNRAALAQAQIRYGVPPAVVTAIIGIETQYGAYMGKHPVAHTLATLGFMHPLRADEFLAEFAEFLLYARERDISLGEIRGSYAGAFGIPQFLPSSARQYGVDFDGDGVADVFNVTDAIGCVGNFLAKKGGWQRGLEISRPAARVGDPVAWIARTAAAAYKPSFTLTQYLTTDSAAGNLGSNAAATPQPNSSSTSANSPAADSSASSAAAANSPSAASVDSSAVADGSSLAASGSSDAVASSLLAAVGGAFVLSDGSSLAAGGTSVAADESSLAAGGTSVAADAADGSSLAAAADLSSSESDLYLFVDLENRYDTEYRLGTQNFYALTRYNKSFKYAASVTDLAHSLTP